MSVFILPTQRISNILSQIEPSFTHSNGTVINQSLQTYLDKVKTQLDHREDEWDRFRKYTNPYEFIDTVVPQTRQPVALLKPLSRSYYKMVEMYHVMNLARNLPDEEAKCFHLCEGPGGFIEAMVDMRHMPSDRYYGMTLVNDDHHVPGWRKSMNFINAHPNVMIETGADHTGNIMHADNFRSCYEQFASSMDLVTADGGFDFSQHYTDQEAAMSQLLYCQTMYALILQKPGGAFVLKVFDLFTQHSVDLLYLLSNLYDQVAIVKPQSSRLANSEKYVVCQGYRMNNSALLRELALRTFSNLKQLQGVSLQQPLTRLLTTDIPYYFLNKLTEFNVMLGQPQLDNILSTLQLMDSGFVKADRLEQLKRQHVQKCICWCNKYNIPCQKIHTTVGNNIFMTSIPSPVSAAS
jgi:23S rRNA U2552 (ribose-2'-O)-methylase RlmE/FtsJ